MSGQGQIRGQTTSKSVATPLGPHFLNRRSPLHPTFHNLQTTSASHSHTPRVSTVNDTQQTEDGSICTTAVCYPFHSVCDSPAPPPVQLTARYTVVKASCPPCPSLPQRAPAARAGERRPSEPALCTLSASRACIGEGYTGRGLPPLDRHPVESCRFTSNLGPRTRLESRRLEGDVGSGRYGTAGAAGGPGQLAGRDLDLDSLGGGRGQGSGETSRQLSVHTGTETVQHIQGETKSNLVMVVLVTRRLVPPPRPVPRRGGTLS